MFDLDSIQLLALGASMAQGTYLSGRKIDPAPKLFLGAVENPGAPPYDYRVERAWKKVRGGRAVPAAAGELRAASGSRRSCARRSTKGLATRSARSSRRSASSARRARCATWTSTCPGSRVPAETIERCERAPDPEQECFEVACELAEHARSLPGVAGLHLISFRREAGIAAALPAARHSDPRRKGDEWIPSSSRGLGPSSSGRSSRSA